MRTNDTAFFWLPEISGNQTYRDYPIHEESLILAMIDVIWAPPYSSDAFHCHNCMEIGLCLEGKGILHMQEGKEQPFEPGSVVIVPKGMRHRQQNMGQPSTRWRYIAINEDLLAQDVPARCRVEIGGLLRRARSSGIFLAEHAMSKDIIWLIQRMFEIKCSCADEGLAALEAIVLLILSSIARDRSISAITADLPSSATHIVDPALLLVAEAYQQDLKVVQMARSCAMSESHFRKVFVQLMGIAPLEYLNRYRIKRAMYLLQTTAAPISQISEECGFLSVTTFNRNFRHYNNMSPSQWRNENVIHGQIDQK